MSADAGRAQMLKSLLDQLAISLTGPVGGGPSGTSAVPGRGAAPQGTPNVPLGDVGGQQGLPNVAQGPQVGMQQAVAAPVAPEQFGTQQPILPPVALSPSIPTSFGGRRERDFAVTQQAVKSLGTAVNNIVQRSNAKKAAQAEAVTIAILTGGGQAKNSSPEEQERVGKLVESKAPKIQKMLQAVQSGDLQEIAKYAGTPEWQGLQAGLTKVANAREQQREQQEQRQATLQKQSMDMAKILSENEYYKKQAEAAITTANKPSPPVKVLDPETGKAVEKVYKPGIGEWETVGEAVPEVSSSVEASQMYDWISKNPGKGPADFMVFKSTLNEGNLERQAIAAYKRETGKEELNLEDLTKIRNAVTEAGATAVTAEILKRQNHLDALVTARERGMIDYRTGVDEIKKANEEFLSYSGMLRVMQEAAKAASEGVAPGANDMVLLSNHIAMTFGSVKGARVGRDLIDAHLEARSLPEDLEVLARRVIAGDRLAPAQRAAFVELASKRVAAAQWQREQVSSMFGRAVEGTKIDQPPGAGTTPPTDPLAPGGALDKALGVTP